MRASYRNCQGWQAGLQSFKEDPDGPTGVGFGDPGFAQLLQTKSGTSGGRVA
jgi:hypothetical protein